MQPANEPAPTAPPEAGSAFRHIKRGTTYTVQGIAKVQSAQALSDGSEVVIYVGTDGQLWARPIDEFLDGRFEKLQI